MIPVVDLAPTAADVITILGFAISWIVGGFLAYGAAYADYQREFPNLAEWRRHVHREYSLIIAGAGWCGLIAVAICTKGFRHGFKWR